MDQNIAKEIVRRHELFSDDAFVIVRTLYWEPSVDGVAFITLGLEDDGTGYMSNDMISEFTTDEDLEHVGEEFKGEVVFEESMHFLGGCEVTEEKYERARNAYYDAKESD